MRSSSRTASMLVATSIVALFQVLGCAAIAPRPLEYETANGPTKDGLLRLRTRVGASFVRPSTSLSRYQKVAIGPSTTTYRAASQRKPSEPPRNGARDSETTARISEILRESLEEEFLQSNRFSVVTEKGANILWIRGHVVDLEIDFSPPPIGERRFGGRLGEVTLVLDVRDSQTGEAKVRFLNRQELAWTVGVAVTNNVAPAAWDAMKESLSEWAHHVRRELEGIADVETPPAPAQRAGAP